jgi:predicted transcriptional regulator
LTSKDKKKDCLVFEESKEKSQEGGLGGKSTLYTLLIYVGGLVSNLNILNRKDLTRATKCNTLLDMKSATLTIRLDKDLNVLLSKASKRSGRNRSEIAREALRRQLRLQQFEELRKRIMPFAEARGFLTDEDVFSQIS